MILAEFRFLKDIFRVAVKGLAHRPSASISGHITKDSFFGLQVGVDRVDAVSTQRLVHLYMRAVLQLCNAYITIMQEINRCLIM